MTSWRHNYKILVMTDIKMSNMTDIKNITGMDYKAKENDKTINITS